MTTSTTSYSGAEQRTSRLRRSPKLAVAALAAILVLSGCASTSINQNFEAARDLGRQPSGAVARWLTTEEARKQAQSDLDARLARPLGADDAVQIALAYSPSLQAMLYEAAADSAAATQSARLPNPVFAFGRLVRNGGGVRDLEINRVLSFSVLDLLLLPAHLRMAGYQQEMTRLSLAGSVVQAANEARGAWVNAVAAQQSLLYAEQIKATADASAELARRMQAVGNYSKLQRAREQAFAADAVAQLARAQHAERSARETLIRVLGLDDAQAAQLKLPDRLPELPKTPRDEASVARTALDQRLDVQLARSRLNFLAQEQGLTRVTSVVNALEIGVSRNSATGAAPQKGYDLSVPLPIFDFGDVRRAGAQAAYMAAVHRTAQIAVQANSRVREQYSAYRTAYDLARHYRDEIVPLRKTIAEENVLRYNGMLIGVFELLADAREQIASVSQAIDAQRDFWLADAGLQSELLGTPGADISRMTEAAPARSGAAAH